LTIDHTRSEGDYQSGAFTVVMNCCSLERRREWKYLQKLWCSN